MRQPFIHDERPLRVYWEVTRACDLACRHCRASAVPNADPQELTDAEAHRLLDQLTGFGAPLPHLVFTGGDPLKRRGLFALIDEARARGFAVSVAPSATPLLTDAAMIGLTDAGVDAISLSLDASTAERHDAIRNIPGTFARTLRAARLAHDLGLPFQVNTLVCQETLDDLPAIRARVRALGAARWSLFFLVTVGRGEVLQPITPEQAEEVLRWVASFASQPQHGMVVTTTEAPQLRRVVTERRRALGLEQRPGPPADGHGHANHAAGIRDGNGILFITHTGDICPSGFLELAVGNVRTENVVEVYRSAELFKRLRDPEGFSGRCGHCEYHWVCGGSRARAWAATGDALAEDPLCVHRPISAGSR